MTRQEYLEALADLEYKYATSNVPYHLNENVLWGAYTCTIKGFRVSPKGVIKVGVDLHGDLIWINPDRLSPILS